MNGKSPVECEATIEDFFSDERDSESSSADEYDLDMSAKSNKVEAEEPGGSKKKKKKKKTNDPSHSLAPVDLSPEEFRKRGHELIDFIANYIEGARDKPLNHQTTPGVLFRKMPSSAPKEGVSFDDVIKDVNNLILPGMTQWQSPKHHALMPLGWSYASLLGGILCDGLGSVSLTWNESPAVVELEMVVMNWLAELMDLPLDFHFFGKGMASGPKKYHGNAAAADGEQRISMYQASSTSGAPAVGGGGIIQSSTTECLMTVVTAAKRMMLETMMERVNDVTEWQIQDRMIAYCSEQAHPSMEKICEVVGVGLKRLWTDKEGIMHCNILKSVLERDKMNGSYPFIVVATAGTIATASVDSVHDIGPYLGGEDPHVWFHIDASYAGSSFICREYQPLLHGLHYADSINVTVHKWLPVHNDCACLWVKKIEKLTFTFGCEDPDGPLTIPHDDKNNMADYRDWGLPSIRRFRAIKLWVVFKLYGVKKLQQKIREDVRRAKEFEKIIHDDHRFEIMSGVMFGIVVFRCKRPDSNDINKEILHQINKSAVIKVTGARVGRKFWLRFVVAGRFTDSEDVVFSWEMIKRTTSKVITEHTERTHKEDRSGMPNYKHVVTIGQSERLDDKE